METGLCLIVLAFRTLTLDVDTCSYILDHQCPCHCYGIRPLPSLPPLLFPTTWHHFSIQSIYPDINPRTARPAHNMISFIYSFSILQYLCNMCTGYLFPQPQTNADRRTFPGDIIVYMNAKRNVTSYTSQQCNPCAMQAMYGLRE